MSRILDPFDELAQLFLTDSDEEQAQQREHGEVNGVHAHEAAPIELLLVGHLPVRADLWLRPYAEAMAREVGTVALVRLDSDEPSVEVLGARADAFREKNERSLRHTLREIAPMVDLWIIRPGGGATADDIVDAGGSRITIISSADEAALVAAYQRIKDLVDAARDGESDMPELGIAILGSAEPVARSMVERLNKTTRTFLNLELPLVATLRQMEAGSRSQAYARFLGERSPGVDDVIGWISSTQREDVELLPVTEAPSAAPVEDDDEPYPFRSVLQEVSDADEVDEDAFEAEPHEAPIAHDEIEATEPESATAHVAGDRDVLDLLHDSHADTEPGARTVRTVKLAPKPVAMHEVKAEAAPKSEPVEHGSASAAALASFIAGVTTVQIRCPGHERIELAVDQDGRFHLLCREDAMRELHLVEAWTRSHRELLAMALPSVKLDASAKPMLHVITDKPVTVADLHGSALHLHVLAPVVVEGKTGWYAAPLNAPAS